MPDFKNTKTFVSIRKVNNRLVVVVPISKRQGKEYFYPEEILGNSKEILYNFFASSLEDFEHKSFYKDEVFHLKASEGLIKHGFYGVLNVTELLTALIEKANEQYNTSLGEKIVL